MPSGIKYRYLLYLNYFSLVPHMGVRGISFLRMETTFVTLWHSLCLKLDDAPFVGSIKSVSGLSVALKNGGNLTASYVEFSAVTGIILAQPIKNDVTV